MYIDQLADVRLKRVLPNKEGEHILMIGAEIIVDVPRVIVCCFCFGHIIFQINEFRNQMILKGSDLLIVLFDE